MTIPSKNKPKRRTKKVDGVRYPYRDGILPEEFKTIVTEDHIKKGIRGDRFCCPINLCCKERIGCKWAEITASTADLMLPNEKTSELEIVRFLLSDNSRKHQKEYDESKDSDKIPPFVVYLVAPYGSRTLDAQQRARNSKPKGGSVTIVGSPKKQTYSRWPRFKELRTPRKAKLSQERKQIGI